jgi:hypothetical protein
VADYDRDGQSDLLLQRPDGSLAFWLMDGAQLRRETPLNTMTPPAADWRARPVR